MEVCVHRRRFFVAEDFLYNNKMKNFLKKNTTLVIGLFVVLLAFFMISSNVEKFISFSDFLMKPANINDIRSDCIVNSLPMGYSGENGRIRLYTASECNKLNGILYPNTVFSCLVWQLSNTCLHILQVHFLKKALQLVFHLSNSNVCISTNNGKHSLLNDESDL